MILSAPACSGLTVAAVLCLLIVIGIGVQVCPPRPRRRR